MESGGIQVLMSPIPGQRVADGKDAEDGSVLAFRSGGEECLFASWESDPVEDAEGDEVRGRGMVWIPVVEFSPDPESIRPPDIVSEGEEEQTDQETGVTTRPAAHGPMGGSRPRSTLPRRPTEG